MTDTHGEVEVVGGNESSSSGAEREYRGTGGAPAPAETGESVPGVGAVVVGGTGPHPGVRGGSSRAAGPSADASGGGDTEEPDAAVETSGGVGEPE